MVQYWRSSQEWDGVKRWGGGMVISVPEAGRTFNLLMLFLIITFSIATTELQWQETDKKIKNTHVIYACVCVHIHTLLHINPTKLQNSVMVFKNITQSFIISYFCGRLTTKKQN